MTMAKFVSLLHNPTRWWNLLMSSDSSWLTTLKCSSPDTNIIHPSDTFMQVLQWLRFIFFSPCPQRLVFSSINLFFLFILLLFLLHRLISKFLITKISNNSINKPLLGNTRILHVKLSSWFKLTFISAALLALLYVVLCYLLLMGSKARNPKSWNQTEVVFRIAEAVAQVAILVLVAHERKFLLQHILCLLGFIGLSTLYLYFVSVFLLLPDLCRFMRDLDLSMKMDDVFSLISLPISFFLLLVASKESSGIVVIKEAENSLNEPIVDDPSISEYEKANFFSKTTWLWMNIVINKGYNNPLKIVLINKTGKGKIQ